MIFGQRIKAARKYANLTQEQLAERVRQLADNEKFKQQTIQRIESGKISSSGYVALIAKATGTNAVWLTTGEGIMLESQPAPEEIKHTETNRFTRKDIELLREVIIQSEKIYLEENLKLNADQRAKMIAAGFAAYSAQNLTAKDIEQSKEGILAALYTAI